MRAAEPGDRHAIRRVGLVGADCHFGRTGGAHEFERRRGQAEAPEHAGSAAFCEHKTTTMRGGNASHAGAFIETCFAGARRLVAPQARIAPLPA